ncbi:hypothetical protein PVAP13_9KG392903 [Panicum virgatum]|uniref:Uncharacterized protein n=1 Tax=Panicum virgatum TaxID=38727 RepID=A0A8T0N9S7_PANVG|nr:hypothetical protein PVAP13_9KG392903 [Panicum virgatum]
MAYKVKLPPSRRFFPSPLPHSSTVRHQVGFGSSVRRARLRSPRLPLHSPAAVVLVLGDAPPSSLGLRATRFFLDAGGHIGFGADRICFLFFLFFGFLCLFRAPQGEIDPQASSFLCWHVAGVQLL